MMWIILKIIIYFADHHHLWKTAIIIVLLVLLSYVINSQDISSATQEIVIEEVRAWKIQQRLYTSVIEGTVAVQYQNFLDARVKPRAVEMYVSATEGTNLGIFTDMITQITNDTWYNVIKAVSAEAEFKYLLAMGRNSINILGKECADSINVSIYILTLITYHTPIINTSFYFQ